MLTGGEVSLEPLSPGRPPQRRRAFSLWYNLP